MSATLLETETEARVITDPEPRLSDNKPESAHIVHKPEDEPDESDHAYVMRARIEGFPVTALCGWVFVPQKMATGLPVCQECKDIWDNLPDDGEGWVRE